MILLLIQLTIKYSIHAADHNPRQNLLTYEIHVATIKDGLEVKYKLDCFATTPLPPIQYFAITDNKIQHCSGGISIIMCLILFAA